MTSGQPTLVLLVEDDPDHVLLIQRSFRKAEIGCLMEVASNGEEAIDFLRRGDESGSARPRLILLDLKLPRKSGFEVLSWLRRTPSCEDLPVVVLTTSEHPDDIRRALKLGANAYVVKPVDSQKAQDMAKSLGMFWLTHHRGMDT